MKKTMATLLFLCVSSTHPMQKQLAQLSLDTINELSEENINEYLRNKKTKKLLPQIRSKTVDLSQTTLQTKAHRANAFNYQFKGDKKEVFSIRAYANYLEKQKRFKVTYLRVYKNTFPYTVIGDQSDSPITAFATDSNNKFFAIGRKDGSIDISQLAQHPEKMDSRHPNADATYHFHNNKIRALGYDETGTFLFALAKNNTGSIMHIPSKKWNVLNNIEPPCLITEQKGNKQKKVIFHTQEPIKLNNTLLSHIFEQNAFSDLVLQQKKDLLRFALMKKIAQKKRFTSQAYNRYLRTIKQSAFSKNIRQILVSDFVDTVEQLEQEYIEARIPQIIMCEIL